MKHNTTDRRDFVKVALAPAALPWVGGWTAGVLRADEGAPENSLAPPDIIDTNVHLFDWPLRRLKYAQTDRLVAKLSRHRITQAWAGSFEAVFTKQLDAANRRLADECRQRGAGMLLPIGCVNPAWPDWQEDLRRCHEQYQMIGVRLYPAYHGYTLASPDFEQLVAEAARRRLIVQIVLRLEDERIHHPALDIPPVDMGPLVEVAKKQPTARIQLLNAAGPLLGNHVAPLVRETSVVFDIAACEGNGGVGRLIEGKNPSYRGAIPIERLLFGSHAPYFPCETAVLKLFESPLTRGELEAVMNSNARRWLAVSKE